MQFANPRKLTGVITSMIIWAIWFVVVYALVGIGCEEGWQERRVPGGNLLSISMLVTTVAALAPMAYCAWSGWRSWHQASADAGQESWQRHRFLGLVMLVLALLAIAGTLLVGLPMLMLDPCQT